MGDECILAPRRWTLPYSQVEKTKKKKRRPMALKLQKSVRAWIQEQRHAAASHVFLQKALICRSVTKISVLYCSQRLKRRSLLDVVCSRPIFGHQLYLKRTCEI